MNLKTVLVTIGILAAAGVLAMLIVHFDHSQVPEYYRGILGH